MHILWLKSDLLLPLDKGGKLRTWHLMRQLACRHEITYLSFRDVDQPMADVEGMREVAAHVETIPRSNPPKGSWRFYADAASHVLGTVPYAVAKYRSRAFARRLRTLLATEPFDLVVCDFLVPAVNLPRRLPCPAVMFTHNVESEIWRRHAELKSRWLERGLYASQYRRMLRFEARTLERFDSVLAVSEADRDTLGRLYPGSLREPAHVVATGVDTEYFEPAPSPSAKPHLVFTGSMDWLPNEDAMRYFCRDVLPLVRAQVPDVSLSIVGRAPTPAVARLGDEPGVHVTGTVEDVRPFVRDAAVYIVPLRIGGGTRLKIFEAMAMGKAVVSTTIGAEGLPVVDDVHLRIADQPDAFARVVVDLLRNDAERSRLGAAARTLVVEGYEWSAVAGQLETVLQAAAAKGRAAAGAAAPGHSTFSSSFFKGQIS